MKAFSVFPAILLCTAVLLSGFAVMFCRETTQCLSVTVRLKGPDKNAVYSVFDAAGPVSVTETGKNLLENGFPLTVPEKPYGALIMIEKTEG